jgi:hypothetical protein
MPGRGQPFLVDSHPQKQKIIDGILAGESCRHIADSAVPPIGFNAVQRYRSIVINPMLKEAENLNRVLKANKDGEIGSRPAPVPLSNDTAAIKMVERAIEAAPALSIFRKRLEDLHGRIDNALTRAETAVRAAPDPETGEMVALGADLAPLAGLFNQAHKNLEILGKATGELEPDNRSSVSIQIVCPAAPAGQSPKIVFGDQVLTLEAGAAEHIDDDPISEIGLLQTS